MGDRDALVDILEEPIKSDLGLRVVVELSKTFTLSSFPLLTVARKYANSFNNL